MKRLEIKWSVINVNTILHWQICLFTETKTTDAVIAPNIYFRAHLLGV